MPGRVLLGKRGGVHGLFISQKDVEVTTTSSTTPLAFDSSAVRGMVIHAKGENSLAPNSASNAGAVDSPTTVSISHGLGYVPLFAVRWCTSAQLSSGVATKMFSPHYHRFEEAESTGDEEEPDEGTATEEFGISVGAGTSNLVISNHYYGASFEGDGRTEVFGVGKKTIYYTYIIFKAKDFTGGLGL